MADDLPPTQDDPRLGSWARVGDFVGLVARVREEGVTLFDPGERQVTEVRREDLEPVPAGAIEVILRVDLPVAHGFDEERLRRWTTSLADPVLRGRAAEALRESGLDDGALLAPTRLSVTPSAAGGAVCLCGARTPAPPQSAVPCAACGRQAVSPPRAAGDR
jgi:hypothetical protein